MPRPSAIPTPLSGGCSPPGVRRPKRASMSAMSPTASSTWAASAATGKVYIAYPDRSGTGMVACLNLYDDKVLWKRAVPPGVDRLAISPDGRLLYVPTWEDGRADYINIVDAKSGDIVRQVHFSNRSHDTQYPLSGPIFQETKADDGSGNYLHRIDPAIYSVARIRPYPAILAPYA